MYALLFIVAFALLLGLAQALGWTVDSREPTGWRRTDEYPPRRSPKFASTDRAHLHSSALPPSEDRELEFAGLPVPGPGGTGASRG